MHICFFYLPHIASTVYIQINVLFAHERLLWKKCTHDSMVGKETCIRKLWHFFYCPSKRLLNKFFHSSFKSIFFCCFTCANLFSFHTSGIQLEYFMELFSLFLYFRFKECRKIYWCSFFSLYLIYSFSHLKAWFFLWMKIPSLFFFWVEEQEGKFTFCSHSLFAHTLTARRVKIKKIYH